MNALAAGRHSIRLRLTIVATVLVAIVLALTGIGLFQLQQRELIANLDASLVQRADTIEASIDQAARSGVIANNNADDSAAQIVAASGANAGTVVAQTANLDGATPIGNTSVGDAGTIVNHTGLPLPETNYRVLSRPIDAPTGPALLYVAESTDDIDDTISRLAKTMSGALSLVVAVLAALMWWLVGRTLRPVEAIRAEVADISGTDLHRRVPIPSQDDEIGRLATTMNEMLDRIERSAEVQRRFVADASHELRTPLTRIRTEVEVDVSHPESADHDATNRLVLEEAVSLQRLVDDLLYLARSDSNAIPRPMQPVDLDDILLDEVRRAQSTSPKTFDLAAVSGAHLLGDPDQLRRMLRNLLSNASRHATTSVTIALNETQAAVRLAITDDGPGVPVEIGDRIFERFTRIDDARSSDDGGTGLGLAIVRDIVARHGGTIAVDQEWTDGARFVVTLPPRP